MGPDFSAIEHTSLPQIIGALLTVVLIAAAAILIVSGVCWAYGAATGNWQIASKGRAGLLAAFGAAAAAGAGVGVTWWLIRLGGTL